MTETIPTSEVLNRAADLIQERGWIAGSGWVKDGAAADEPLCLEGGIMAALGMSVPHMFQDDNVLAPLFACPAYRAVSRYLELEPAGIDPAGGFTGQPLYHWNDRHPDGDATPVIEVLRACAVIEASRERESAEVSA